MACLYNSVWISILSRIQISLLGLYKCSESTLSIGDRRPGWGMFGIGEAGTASLCVVVWEVVGRRGSFGLYMSLGVSIVTVYRLLVS